MAARHEQQLERRAAPERGDAHDVVVGEHDPLAGGQLGLDRGADDAAAGEAGEGPLLVEDLARHERQPEDLGVRVGERRAGLATVVDDHLRVADLGRRRRARRGGAAGRRISSAGCRRPKLVDAAVVVGRVHEDLVDAAGLGRDVHRAEVVDDEPAGAVERRVQVGDDAHLPAGRRRRRSRARGSVASSLPGQNGHGRCGSASISAARGAKSRRSLGPLGHDRDPPPGEWVETHLTHSEVQDRTQSVDASHALADAVTGVTPSFDVTRRSRRSAAVHADVPRAVRPNGSALEVLPPRRRGAAGRRPPWRRARPAARSGSTTGAGAPARRRRARRTGRRRAGRSGRARRSTARPRSAVIERTPTTRAARGGSVGHERLDDEHAAGREPGGDGGEAGALALGATRG